MIDAGPRNHLYLLGAQVKIRSCPRNQRFQIFKQDMPPFIGAFLFWARTGHEDHVSIGHREYNVANSLARDSAIPPVTGPHQTL